jgi:hypothetical protein
VKRSLACRDNGLLQGQSILERRRGRHEGSNIKQSDSGFAHFLRVQILDCSVSHAAFESCCGLAS